MLPDQKFQSSSRALRDITNHLHETLTLTEADETREEGLEQEQLLSLNRTGHGSCFTEIITPRTGASLHDAKFPETRYEDPQRKDQLLSRISMAHPPSGNFLSTFLTSG
jgi:hypothetical protein